MKKKAVFSKPTNLQLFKGLVISIVQAIIKGYPDAVVLNKIGKYRLIRKVNKENMLNGNAIGVYQNNEEKVFIKTWSGNLKNFRYYSLVSEFIASKILYKKLRLYRSIAKRETVKIPRPIGYISSKNSLSLIFEYIEGKTITSYPQDKKVEALSEVIKSLNEISKTLTLDEEKQLSKRSAWFYYLSLPFFCLLTIASNPRSYKVIFKSIINCLKASKSLNNERLYLAHRDINLHNILINNRNIYIVDLERVILTVPDYDISYLSLNPDLKLIADLVSQKLNCNSNPFLKNYISIHLANTISRPKGYENFFLKGLYELYS